MKEKEEFIRNMARMQLLNRKAKVVLRRKLGKRLSGYNSFIIPADGRRNPET